MAEKINPAQGKERVRKSPEERCRQNRPIASYTKMRRVYMAEPINETCWAYMKQLRENNKTKKVYEIDPYKEVYRFRENIYGILAESADGMGDVWMYLIIGPEKAMLIDTGFGIGDLKGLCNEITGGKELTVVNTHGHFDHAYGNCQFERVYCHEYEVPSLQNQDEHIWDYLFQEDGLPIWAEFDRKDIVRWKPYEIIGVPDGYTFDLGQGYEIEMIFLGGHTAGHVAFLDRRARTLFCGDDFISMRVGISGPKAGNPYGSFATVRAFCDNLERLAMRTNEFDSLFPGHFVVDLESSVVESMRKACQEVLAAPIANATGREETPWGIRYYKYVQGLGVLAYTEKAL
jgi:glyoxylase-like metal-dependent hydrolase (beta-lactamase superfamily II)